MFGSKVHDNGSIFRGTHHVVTKSDGKGSNAITFEESKVDTEESGRPTHKKVMFYDAIYTVEISRSRFSKTDQLQVDRVRSLRRVAAFPEYSTTSYAVHNNSLRNNVISERDMDVCNDMLGRSKCVSQGIRTMRSSNTINVHNQLIELSPTTKNYYSNLQMAADTLYVNNVPFLTSTHDHMHCGTSNDINNLKAIFFRESVEERDLMM